jgi:GAF domain-containing protein
VVLRAYSSRREPLRRIIATVSELAAVLADLLAATGASRVTLRRDVPGEYAFPVVEEALAPGVGSLREERSVQLPTQPVVLELREGRQVVQHDSREAFDDPDYLRMLDVYGGLAAQIVTPVFADGRLEAIVSVHQLGNRRAWTTAEVTAASAAAARVRELL